MLASIKLGKFYSELNWDETFVHKNLKLILEEIKEKYVIKVIEANHNEIWFILKKINIGLSITIINDSYLTLMHAGFDSPGCSMHLHPKTPQEVMAIIERLFKYQVTAKLVSGYIHDIPDIKE